MDYSEFVRLRELDARLCALLQTDEGKKIYRGWMEQLKAGGQKKLEVA